MSTNPPTFRYPFALAGQPKEVQQAHIFAFQGIQDCQQAIAVLAGKVAGNSAASSTTTNVNTTSETVIQEVAPGTGIGTVNNQSGNTAYTTQQSDNEGLIILNDASPVAVTLNSVITVPYGVFITNFGAGTATLTPTSGTINGGASFSLPQNCTALVGFDGTNWWTTALPIVPANTPAVLHEWINSYNSATGTFTQKQPSYSDLSGEPLVHDEPLTDGNSNFIFAAGDVIVCTGVPN